MRNPQFVTATVRAVFAWACDPDRGRLLPEGFRNPFLRSGTRPPLLKGDPLAAPDVTLPMAVELVRVCDAFQLRLFVPLLLFGLGAAEPCALFADHLRDGWLSVPCVPELGLLTKGRRDKRFPLLDRLKPFWELLRDGRDSGLLLERRAVATGREAAPLRGAAVGVLVGEYRSRCERTDARTAAGRARLRAGVFRDAGGLDYDHLQGEFTKLARELGWPAAATLKDLRHLFATTLTNAGVPEGYVRYLMGHAPGKAALVAYAVLERYGRWLDDEDYAGRSQGLELTTIKQAVKWMVREGMLPATCLLSTKVRKIRGTDTHCYSPEEVRAIIAYCRARDELQWLADVATALARTGLRIGELVDLRWANVDLDRAVLHLRDTSRQARKSERKEAQTTKSHRDRALAIHPDLLAVLRRLPRAADGRVFHGPRGGRLKPDTVGRTRSADHVGL